MNPYPKLLASGPTLLYEDPELLVLDKPSGLACQPTPSEAASNLELVLRGRFDAKARSFRNQDEELFLVHRLDTETSGVWILARNPATQEALNRLFQTGKVFKEYMALMTRPPRPSTGRWSDHLIRQDVKGSPRTKILPKKSANAHLRYRWTGKSLPGGAAWVEILLETGKTHQIRVQAAARKCPVLGDGLYGDFAKNRDARKKLGLRRLALHAHRIRFPHPSGKKPIDCRAPLPPELEQLKTS